MDRAVAAGEAWAVRFLLMTLGKDRGYVTRQDISFPDGTMPPISYVRVHSSGANAETVEDAALEAIIDEELKRRDKGPGANGQANGSPPSER